MLELDDCLIATALATLACTGCASTPEQEAEYDAPKIYRTGSNLPAKDYGNLKTLDAEELQRTQRTAPARSLAKP